jgi:hypothetical protein
LVSRGGASRGPAHERWAKVVATVSAAVDVDEATLITEAGLTALTADSLNAALDLDWDDDDAQRIGLHKLHDEVTSLQAWVHQRAKTASSKEPLKDALAQRRLVVGPDIEPDPDGGGSRIVDGTAKDRIISVGDTEMRHGCRGRTTRIDGDKRDIVVVDCPIAAPDGLTSAPTHPKTAACSP